MGVAPKLDKMYSSVEKLVFLLGKKRSKNILVFNPQKQKTSQTKSRFNSLFNAINDKKVTSNWAVARFWNYKNPQEKAYIVAMGRFKESLIHRFFHLDEKHLYPNEFIQKQAVGIKLLTFGRLLLLAGMHRLALEKFQKAILIAKKFEILDLWEEAMRRYLIIGVRIGKGVYLDQYIADYPEVKRGADELADMEFQMTALLRVITSKTRINKEGRKQLRVLVAKMNAIQNSRDNLRIEELRFLANSYLFQLFGDAESLFKICNTYENKLSKHPQSRNKHFSVVAKNKLVAMLRLSTYKECSNYFEKSKKYFSVETSNYINYLEAYFLACMRFGEYQLAKNLIAEAISSPYFKNLPPSSRERWMIYEPFLIFAYSMNVNKELNLELSNESFEIKMERVMNKKPIAVKDKIGLNAQIIISQTLILLLERNEDKEDAIIEKARSMGAYTYRYFKKVKGGTLLRTYYFIQFLIKLSESSFNKTKLIRTSKNLIEKLKAIPIENVDLTENVEVIPYENLIDLIFESLDN